MSLLTLVIGQYHGQDLKGKKVTLKTLPSNALKVMKMFGTTANDLQQKN